MMPQYTERLEQTPERRCSLEQARALLESLRAAYQPLSAAERDLVKSMIGRAQRKRLMQEMNEERECFESVS